MFYMSFLSFSEEVANHQSLSEKLTSILTTGIGGYLLVFTILALIWLLLSLIGKFFDRKQDKGTAVNIVSVQVPAPEPEPKTDDAATVAAIVAAISAYSGKSASEFKVVSFRKKH